MKTTSTLAWLVTVIGIMGGDSTAVSDSTRNIYVEAAFWWPEAVAGRSRRFNFSTDAGHRFERGVDPSLTVEHIEHITRLILEICGGEAGPAGQLPKGQSDVPQECGQEWRSRSFSTENWPDPFDRRRMRPASLRFHWSERPL